MQAKDIRIVFFDIGGVLLSNGWGHESREKAAARFGYDLAKMNYLHDFIFNVYEIGRITLDEYLNTVLFYEPRGFTKEEYIDFMYRESTQLPQMLDWLLEWKKTLPDEIKIISINNEGRELNEYRLTAFGLRRFFDAFVSSCEVGMRKPDPGIFQLALGIAQAKPEECLYFDDRIILVDAARKLGINGIQHVDFETTKNILSAIGRD